MPLHRTLTPRVLRFAILDVYRLCVIASNKHKRENIDGKSKNKNVRSTGCCHLFVVCWRSWMAESVETWGEGRWGGVEVVKGGVGA